MMGDCRERLGAYVGGLEDEVKLLQETQLTAQERAAASLRMAEKRILVETMAAVRRRLAPIRGIPTKSGKMQSPNRRALHSPALSLPQADDATPRAVTSWRSSSSLRT